MRKTKLLLITEDTFEQDNREIEELESEGWEMFGIPKTLGTGLCYTFTRNTEPVINEKQIVQPFVGPL